MGAWVHGCMGACVHGCMRACVHACMLACILTCILTCMHTSNGVCTRAGDRTRIGSNRLYEPHCTLYGSLFRSKKSLSRNPRGENSGLPFVRGNFDPFKQTSAWVEPPQTVPLLPRGSGARFSIRAGHPCAGAALILFRKGPPEYCQDGTVTHLNYNRLYIDTSGVFLGKPSAHPKIHQK